MERTDVSGVDTGMCEHGNFPQTCPTCNTTEEDTQLEIQGSAESETEDVPSLKEFSHFADVSLDDLSEKTKAEIVDLLDAKRLEVRGVSETAVENASKVAGDQVDQLDIDEALASALKEILQKSGSLPVGGSIRQGRPSELLKVLGQHGDIDTTSIDASYERMRDENGGRGLNIHQVKLLGPGADTLLESSDIWKDELESIIKTRDDVLEEVRRQSNEVSQIVQDYYQ